MGIFIKADVNRGKYVFPCVKLSLNRVLRVAILHRKFREWYMEIMNNLVRMEGGAHAYELNRRMDRLIKNMSF